MMPDDRDTSPDADEDDADADGCLCGIDHGDDDEVTLDQELPTASGGVDTNDEDHLAENEDDVDGCELDFSEVDQTTDEELPVSAGGM
jgi:hypothetical protein